MKEQRNWLELVINKGESQDRKQSPQGQQID